MFWVGLLFVVAGLVIGAVLMHRSMNFREFITASFQAIVEFLKPFLKRTWFWAIISIGGVLLGGYIMIQSLNG